MPPGVRLAEVYKDVFFPIIQVVSVALVVVYLVRSRSGVRRANAESWETLVARLDPSLRLNELNGEIVWKEGLSATPEDTWKNIQGTRGLWMMYRNAGVMQRISDYAIRNGDNVDLLLVETLRSDATQVRFCVLMTLSQHFFSRASEGVRMNAYQAASMYTGMAARMSQLLNQSFAIQTPCVMGVL